MIDAKTSVSYHSAHDFASWEYLFGETKRRVARSGPAQDQPLAVIPCELVTSMQHGSNGKVLNVRCRCMAGTIKAPAARYYNYDMLGEAKSLAEARLLWDDHVTARAQAPTR